MRHSILNISERHHTALILMSELARLYTKNRSFTRLSDIAKTMQAPLGYLEEIAFVLKRANFVEGRPGRSGGYRLAKKPKDITAAMIITALENPVITTRCPKSCSFCPISTSCGSQKLWHRLHDRVTSTLEQTTLADLINLS